jgi:hypothetical protein
MTAIKINGAADIVTCSDGRLMLNIPINIRRKSGVRVITLPNGERGKAGKTHEPTPIQQALARGHRWLAMLESGEVSTLRELALKEGVDNSYITRMVNLTTLAPEIVAAILDDALPNNITLLELAVNLPLLWDEQLKRVFGEQEKDATTSA